MEIIIDNIVFYLQITGGISVVWFEIINRLMKERNVNLKFIEHGDSNNIFRKDLNINKELILNRSTFLLKVKRYLSVNVKNNEKFIFHSTYYRTSNNRNAINFTTVHDFTYEYFFNRGIGTKLHCMQKNDAIRKSDYIICISESTKRDLLKFIPDTDPHKIFVIHNGVSDDYYPLLENPSYKLPFEKNNYLLFVGSRTSYKNFNLVLDVVSHTDLNLIIVGPPLTEEERLYITRKKIHETRYRCMSNISNRELNILYNNAFSLIYPSSYEGFGIPVLEAQKAGCPVIAYNNSSIPEIIGQKKMLVDNLAYDSFISKLDILCHKESRDMIIKEGLINSSKYTWNDVFYKLYSLYETAWQNR